MENFGGQHCANPICHRLDFLPFVSKSLLPPLLLTDVCTFRNVMLVETFSVRNTENMSNEEEDNKIKIYFVIISILLTKEIIIVCRHWKNRFRVPFVRRDCPLEPQ